MRSLNVPYLSSAISQIKLISLDIGPSGMPRTIIATLEDVKCSPIRSISALLWGNYLPAQRKSLKSSVLALGDANLSCVQNLTIAQLCVVRTLHGITDLAPQLTEQIKEKCPDLLDEEEEESILPNNSFFLWMDDEDDEG